MNCCNEKCNCGCKKVEEEIRIEERTDGPFGRSGELLFKERGVTVTGKIIGVDI